MTYLDKVRRWEQKNKLEIKQEVKKMGKVIDIEVIRRMFGGTFVECDHPFIDTQEVK